MRISSIRYKFRPYFLFLLLGGLFFTACTPVKAVSGLDESMLPASTASSTDLALQVTPVSPTALALQVTPTVIIQATSHAPNEATSAPVDPPTCSEKTGSQITGVVDSKLLPKAMRYIVYLPPCYSSDLQKRYPVLYLLHGQGSTEEQWIRIGAVSSADQLIASGKTAPFIMVFPFDYSYLQPSEYKFEDVFIQLLIPGIDDSYRTQTSSLSRAIGGLSRGGAWALHIGARHPDLFGAIGGHSASIFYADENVLPRTLLAIPLSQRPRIWLDAGDRDSEHDLITPFEAFLTDNGIQHEWHEYIGSHEEKYWSAHVSEYLRWYAQGWR